jgi:hypothetical protein
MAKHNMGVRTKISVRCPSLVSTITFKPDTWMVFLNSPDKMLWVYGRKRSKPHRAVPDEIARQRDFYTIPNSLSGENIEQYLSTTVENPGLSAVRQFLVTLRLPDDPTAPCDRKMPCVPRMAGSVFKGNLQSDKQRPNTPRSRIAAAESSVAGSILPAKSTRTIFTARPAVHPLRPNPIETP